VSPKPQEAAICDANVLIDYADSDEDIIRELVRYWGKVYVPTRILHEVKRLPQPRAEELGLTIIETPLVLPSASGLSGPDRSCLHFVITEGCVCIANDKALRKECQRRGGMVVWGLEMLAKLVEAQQITKARAIDIATHIRMINPEISEALLADFKAMLAKL
jgi:rRNA-processing protein FCF1